MAIEETISVDASEAISALDELAAAAESAASKFQAAMDRLKVPAVGGGGADKLASSMDAAAAKIDESVAKIESAFDKLSGMGDSAAAGLEKIGEAADGAAGPLDAAAAAADEAAAAQDRLAESADIAGASLDRTSASADAAAASTDAAAAGAAAGAESHSKLGEYALGAAVIIGYATDKAMKFNAQMVTLNTQAGVSKNQLGALSEGVLELAGPVGQSPTSLAESLYHVESNMQSLGIKAPQALNMVKVAAEGASVGHANLVDVTNALTAAVASGIPGVKNYSQAMGVLNATVGAGDMTMQDLADAMGTGAVAAVKGYGLNIKDVGAALAVFGDNNIRGAKAGTDLRMSVQALAVPVSTAKAELSKLGLTTTTLATDMQSGGLLKALDDLQSRFKATGITAKNEGEVITDLFGKKAGVGLSILMEQMGRLQSKYPDLTKGANDFGQAWATTQQTAQQKLKQLESGAQAMAITLGNIALPSADKIMGGLDKAMEFVQSHAFASKGLTLGLGTLIAGGLAKGIFSGVESSLEGIGKLGSLLKIPGLDKLAGIGQNTGLNASASALDGSASSLEGAAASLDGAAGKLGGGGLLPGGKTGTAAEGEAGAEDAVALGIGSKISAAIGKGLGAGIVAAIGLAISKAIIDPLENKKNPAVLGNTNPKSWWNSYSAAFNSSIAGHVTDWMEELFGGGPGTPAPKPGKDWTSVLGGSAPYPAGTALNIPASRFALPPALGTPGVGSRYTGAPPVVVVSEPSIPMLGAGGHPGTVPAPQPVTAGVPMLGAGGHPSTLAVPTVNDSALVSAKGKIQADLNAINQALSASALHPGKIPAPDISALESAKGKITADLTQIDQAMSKSAGKPVTIPAPDLSALTAAAGKAGQAASQITQAMTTALGHAPIAAAPNLNAYKAAAGVAASDGQAISAGLASGILAGEGAAVAAAQQVAAAVTAAMKVSLKISSPSKVTQEIGSETVQGLIQGLEGGTSNLQAVTSALYGAMANPDAVSTVQQTIQELIGDVPSKDTALVKWLGQQQAKEVALANKQGALMAQISDAQQIATSAISAASITGASGYTPALAASNGPQAAQSLITGMQQQLADTKSFASQLAQLQKMGLNATTESQLAQAGTATGLPLAMGLAQGGKGAVGQINAIEKQIIGASQKIGDVGGTAMYNAGLQVGQGLDTALKGALKQIGKEMAAEASEIVAKVGKAAGGGSAASSSPASGSSTAAAAAGGTAMAVSGKTAATGLGSIGPAARGAATGLDSVGPAAATAAAGLSKISSVLAGILGTGGGGHAQPLGGGGAMMKAGGGTQQPVVVHVHLDGQVIATSTTNIQTQAAAQNWQGSPVPLPAGRR